MSSISFTAINYYFILINNRCQELILGNWGENMENENLTMALTPEQCAAETSLHVNTIYRLIKEGSLPHIKLARRYLISRVEFEKWLSGNQPNGKSST